MKNPIAKSLMFEILEQRLQLSVAPRMVANIGQKIDFGQGDAAARHLSPWFAAVVDAHK